MNQCHCRQNPCVCDLLALEEVGSTAIDRLTVIVFGCLIVLFAAYLILS